MLHNYCRQYLKEEKKKDSDSDGDNNRFESDFKIYNDWFTQKQNKLRPKLEFFFVPYIDDDKARRIAINNIKCRRAHYFETLANQKHDEHG